MTRKRDRTFLRSATLPIYLTATLSLVYLIVLNITSRPDRELRRNMVEASRLMVRATEAVRNCRLALGILIDPVNDPNGTGLIGLETSPITTSLGSLEAKRTTINPNFAGLVVMLLHDAGVRKGDAVAVGASSSFPALIIATLSALKTIEAEARVISSLGSSEWGANIPRFNWLDMDACLRAAGVFDVRPIALSVGGDEDIGWDMNPAGRALIGSRLREADIPWLEEPDLARNVGARMQLYFAAGNGRPVKAFVNIGGSWANIGTNAEILTLRPGLTRRLFIPGPADRGVIQAMAKAGVPVIHLLNVKGLCERYGLPWDARPLPEAGREGFPRRDAGSGALPALLSVIYIGLVLAALVSGRGRFP